MKKLAINESAKQYAIRRLVRKGSLLASDIIRATGYSKPTATSVISDLLISYPNNLIKVGPRLNLIEMHHSWLQTASDAQLLEAIKNGGREIDTGLRTSRTSGKGIELPVNIHTFNMVDTKEGLITQIAKCLTMQSPIDHRASMNINYVSMSHRECAKWRRIVPIGLERVLDQWRVVAHDMRTNDMSVKTYILTRIIDYSVATEPLPKKFERALFANNQSIQPLTLNVNLTPDQEAVIKKELNVMDNNTIQIDPRIVFEYLRRFGAIAPSKNAVWPIVTKIGEKQCT